jgi:hypothetical protein
MNSNRLINVATPIASTDAATKGYVDTSIQGISVKTAVRAATTVSGTLATSFANGQVIDGITLVTGDRILIKDQVSPIENGIYVVNLSGTPTRASDFAVGLPASGVFVFVTQGTANGDNGYIVTTDPPNNIIGTHGIVFAQFSGAGQIIAGTGLTKSGNTLSVNATLGHVTQIGTLTSFGVSGVSNLGVTNAANITASGTLGVTGTSTLGVVNSGNTAITGTLSVSGTSTLAAANATNITASGTLGVTGTSTLGVVNSGNTSITGTLNVSGVSTVSTLTSANTTASTSNNTGVITLAGGIGISNTTDATSITNGGTFTTAGGVAIAKRAFIGDNMFISGNTVVGNSNPISSERSMTVSNTSNNAAALSMLRLQNDTANNTVLFLNSSTRATDGGANTATLRNDSGSMRIQSSSSSGLTILSSGVINTDNSTASTSSTVGSIVTSGGISINNNTDAVSATNGGTFTTAGGAAIARRLFVGESVSIGTSLSVAGSSVLTGSMTASTATFSGAVAVNSTTSSTSNTTGALTLAGGLGISNTANAVSATNGGSFTTAGGMAVAQSAYIGNALFVTNGITFGGLSAINNASNTGVGGISVYRDISGSTMRFRSINVTNNKLSVALDAVNNEVDIGLNEANIVHQNLSGAGTNTHAQIDSHIASTSNPHNVTINQVSPATTKGDLLVRDSSVTTRLPVGLDNQVLIADSASGTGLRWGVTSGALVVLLKDVKNSGTDAGSSTANTWLTRVLNTIEGNFIAAGITLTSNTFTLPPGRYLIYASSPGFRCRGFKNRLFNVTDNVTETVGQAGYAGNPSLSSSTNSFTTLDHYIEILTETDFIIQQNCETSYNSEGFGRAVGFGINEVYTTVRIDVLEQF